MIPFKIEQLPTNVRLEVERFLSENPDSPAAQLRPQLASLRDLWMAFVGPEMQDQDTGFGFTPCEALADFNRRFFEPLFSRNGHES